MQITDATKRNLSQESYYDLEKGRNISTPSGKFEVIEKGDDTQNGLRAYAYAPIVNGKPDTNNIVMGYAGTEFTSIKDWKTNLSLPYHNTTIYF